MKLTQSIMDQIVGKKGASFTINCICSLHKTIFIKKKQVIRRKCNLNSYNIVILYHCMDNVAKKFK